jgi:kinesin family protein 5
MLNYYTNPNKRIPLIYINVFCRFRPPNEIELEHTSNNCITILSPKQLLVRKDNNLDIQQDYTFDGLFLPDTPLEQFYTRTTKQIIENVLVGYNGAVICYGQTGTGKTYTMNEIVPLAIKQIFHGVNTADFDNEIFKITVSMLEIYKEQVNDLIDTKKTNLNVIENKLKKNKLTIENLTSIPVSSESELKDIIYKGNIKRNTNTELMKEYSAKTHNIIIIVIYRYYKDKNCMKTGTLYLCDLEGSEKITKMNLDEGESIEEQKLVNKSLAALSSVVQNLSIKNDSTFHVPYRDSKLTRILSECLGGNAYTTLILTCTQNEYNLSETRNTLLFGERAKKIRNKPVVNIELNADKNPIIREVLNQRNELLNNLDEKERNAMKAMEYKKMYENEIIELKSQIKQLKESHNLDVNVIEELKGNISILENEKQRLILATQQMTNQENEILDLNKKVKNLKKKEEKNEELIEKLKEDGNKLRIANENIKYLEIEKENHIQEIEEKESNIKELERSLKEKEKNIKNLNSDLDQKMNQIKILETKIEKINKNFKEQNDDKDKIIRELENNLEKEKLKLIEKSKKCQELIDNLSEADNKIISYESKMKDQNRIINNNTKEISELQKEIEILKNKIENLEKGKIKLISTHESEVEKLQKEIFDLKSNVNKLKNELNSKENNIQYLNEQKEKLEKTKEENTIKIKEQNLDLQDKIIQLNSLKEEINEKKLIIKKNDLKIKEQNTVEVFLIPKHNYLKCKILK